jgi:hypothetical protein
MSDGTGQAPRLVRPYALTRGRTRPSGASLPLEALVVATPAAATASLGLERAAIVRACTQPASVVDLSARLGIPVGVTRVLVSDLAAEDLVQVHGAAGGTDLQLLERVLDGISSL